MGGHIMNSIDKFSFFKEMYFFEIKRKDNVSPQTQILITIFAAIITALFFFLKFFINIDKPWGFFHCAFCLFLLLTIFAIVGVLVCLIMAIYPINYMYLNQPLEILRQWEISEENKKQQEHINHLTQRLAESVNYNKVQNDKRYDYIWKSKLFLIISIICLMLISFLYLMYQFK
jgi:Ca2+/Na+ antiporter